MTAVAILDEARSLGVALRVEGDTIKAKGPRPAVERLLPALREHKSELLAALSTVVPDGSEVSGHWLIVQPPERIEKYFSPPVSRAQLEILYPGCLLVALADTTARPPVGLELDERHGARG